MEAADRKERNTFGSCPWRSFCQVMSWPNTGPRRLIPDRGVCVMCWRDISLLHWSQVSKYWRPGVKGLGQDGRTGVYINKGTWHLFYEVIQVREFLELFTQGILRGDANKSYILTVYYNSKGAFIYLFHVCFLIILISITSTWQINGKIAWPKIS